MLSHLVIRNFAVIESLELPLQRGLTVLTGETGAGKSIIVDALNLLLGGRGSTEVIRTAEEEAIVEGVFELADPARVASILAERGLDACDGQLIIRRIISRGGRSKVFVNGGLTTVAVLGELTRGLVDISGQHEHFSLTQPERHVDILDAFAGNLQLRRQMQRAWERYEGLRAERRALDDRLRDRAARIDFLRFQLAEIEDVKPRVGEDVELRRELDLLKNAETITKAALGAVEACYEGDPSVAALLADAIESLRSAERFEPALQAAIAQLAEARIVVEEVARDLQGRFDDLEADPQRIDDVYGRLEALRRLERKHAGDLQWVIDHAETMRTELDVLENADARGSELEEELRRAEEAAFEVAQALSKSRRHGAEELQSSVEVELAELNMPRASFVVDIEPRHFPRAAAEVPLGPRGFDEIQFLISANVGEEPKPLQRIASGGEMSRIMLAIKTVHSDQDSVATYIFDEVDSGIGGETADRVGEKLRRTAADHQVLCVTHLPQIASRGTMHLRVEKTHVDGRTHSHVRVLDTEQRVEEIARMLGGARVSDKTVAAARDLLGG